MSKLNTPVLSINESVLSINNIDSNAEFVDLYKNNKFYKRMSNLDNYGMPTSYQKLTDYAYEAEYSTLDYVNAYNHFSLSANNSFLFGGCSAIRKGNLYGRNFDWTYDNNAEFVVKTLNNEGRFASLSVCLTNIADSSISKGEISDAFKLIPFQAVDGINENGVVINVNVVPTDLGRSTIINESSGTLSINASMIPRYILDYAQSADHAISLINTMKIFYSTSFQDMGYETHYMIADSAKTYLVEFINNQIVTVDMTSGSGNALSGKSYFTNFYLSNVRLNSDGTVNTPASRTSGSPSSVNNVTPHGSGLERYNMIVRGFSLANSKAIMRTLLHKLKYTNTYLSTTSPYWYTEAVGSYQTYGNITVDTTTQGYTGIINALKNLYYNRSRDTGKTWHTVHSVIYDMTEKSASIHFQEQSDEFFIQL